MDLSLGMKYTNMIIVAILALRFLRRISIQCISSRARQFAIDLQSGHAYFALFGSTIRARDRTKK